MIDMVAVCESVGWFGLVGVFLRLAEPAFVRDCSVSLVHGLCDSVLRGGGAGGGVRSAASEGGAYCDAVAASVGAVGGVWGRSVLWCAAGFGRSAV